MIGAAIMEIKQVLPVDVIKRIMVIPEDFSTTDCEVTVKPIENKLGRRSQLIRKLCNMAPDIQGLDAEEIIASEICKKHCV